VPDETDTESSAARRANEPYSPRRQEKEKVLTRPQVLMFRNTFKHYQDNNTQIKYLRADTGINLPEQYWALVAKALKDLKYSTTGRVDIAAFLQKVFPSAQPKYLRMYVAWCHEFDELQELIDRFESVDKLAKRFLGNSAKPIIPNDEYDVLESNFDVIDWARVGFVTAQDIAVNWDLGIDTVILSTYGITNPHRISKKDYLEMACPGEYRLPQMDGKEEEALGMLMLSKAARMKREISEKQNLSPEIRTKKIASIPADAMPEVDAATWGFWNQLFDDLDRNGDNLIQKAELIAAGRICSEVCTFLVMTLDPEHNKAFSRRTFLSAMLEAYQYRHTDFSER